MGVVGHVDRFCTSTNRAGPGRPEIKDLALEDRQGRFALDDTDGGIGWDRSKVVPVSRLAYRGQHLPNAHGAFDVRVHFAADHLDLVEPVVVPVLGGSIALDRFALSGALIAGARSPWEPASASLRDVSLEQLTRTLEWPPFNGSIWAHSCANWLCRRSVQASVAASIPARSAVVSGQWAEHPGSRSAPCAGAGGRDHAGLELRGTDRDLRVRPHRGQTGCRHAASSWSAGSPTASTCTCIRRRTMTRVTESASVPWRI